MPTDLFPWLGNCRAAPIVRGKSVLAYKLAYNSGSTCFRLLPKQHRRPGIMLDCFRLPVVISGPFSHS